MSLVNSVRVVSLGIDTNMKKLFSNLTVNTKNVAVNIRLKRNASKIYLNPTNKVIL